MDIYVREERWGRIRNSPNIKIRGFSRYFLIFEF